MASAADIGGTHVTLFSWAEGSTSRSLMPHCLVGPGGARDTRAPQGLGDPRRLCGGAAQSQLGARRAMQLG